MSFHPLSNASAVAFAGRAMPPAFARAVDARMITTMTAAAT